ncbi:hypothetical protein MNBD_GAMMA03-1465 [hydrothermal vent metagenome]|uniref:Uncharacterized protein n=1 Tax=hydrothermal vent metagenome TaxID=652676 RepID=A0A3B0W7A5_9ZZZZ
MKLKLTLLSTLVLFAASTVAKITEDTKGTTTYEITKHTISSGGGQISGGVYTLVTSIGQIDAGHNASGSTYEFNGGFLAGATNTNDNIFKNGFE